jgi:MSHA biogenesis protein MshG
VSRFRYRGRSGRGDLITGRLEAETVDAVASRLLNLGITPLQIDADSDRSTSIEELLRRLGAGRPSTVDLVLFSRQMYAITKSGLPLLRGLRGLAESTHNVVMRDALHDVLQSLESGRDLASSLARHPTIFSSLFLSMVRVGESTGTLDNAFLRLCDYLGQDQDVQDRVKAALRYPIIVVIMIALAVGVITVFVIPNFAPLFKILGQ